jgi:hypothetical protein
VGHGDRLAAFSVLAILLAVYTATMTGLPDNPDAEVEFQTTSALVREHTLALSGTPEAEAIVEHQFDVVRGLDGGSYAWFGPGQALVALPFYAVGRGLACVWPAIEARHAATTRLGAARSEYFAHLLVGWRNPLLSALTGFLIVLTARRLGMGRPAAWLAGLTYGLASFAWAQARSTLSDVQAAFFLVLAFHGLVLVAERFQRLRQPRAHELAAVGLALGLGVLTRVAALPAAAVVLAASVSTVGRGNRRIQRTYEPAARPDKRSRFALLAFLTVPFGACLLVFAWLNQLRFGDPLETGYGAVLGTFFSYPVPIAFTQSWHGAWTYGPRYLLPLLPFAWIAVGFALEKPRPWLRRLACALFALGFTVALPASLVDHVTHNSRSAPRACNGPSPAERASARPTTRASC